MCLGSNPLAIFFPFPFPFPFSVPFCYFVSLVSTLLALMNSWLFSLLLLSDIFIRGCFCRIVRVHFGSNFVHITIFVDWSYWAEKLSERYFLAHFIQIRLVQWNELALIVMSVIDSPTRSLTCLSSFCFTRKRWRRPYRLRRPVPAPTTMLTTIQDPYLVLTMLKRKVLRSLSSRDGSYWRWPCRSLLLAITSCCGTCESTCDATPTPRAKWASTPLIANGLWNEPCRWDLVKPNHLVWRFSRFCWKIPTTTRCHTPSQSIFSMEHTR